MKFQDISEHEAGSPDSIVDTFSQEQTTTDSPVVGIQFRKTTDLDRLAGSILRAQQANHDVIIYSSVTIPDLIKDIIAQLEVPVIQPEKRADADPVDLVTLFARTTGYPGVLLKDDLEYRIDFERSAQRLQTGADYVIEASYEPPLPPEPHVLVGIPAYNEQQAIADVVANAQPNADDVLVVDDGSDDRTVERADSAGATVIEHETNQGYGGALKTIFENASRVNADSLVIVDADGQHDPEEIPALVETQQATDAEIVIGSRFSDGGWTDAPLYRRFGLGVVNILTNLSLGVVRPASWITDTQSGFRLYSGVAIDSLADADDIGDTMSASTDILYHAHHNNFDIEEAGAEVNYDVEDASNINPISHGITLVMNILRTIEQDRPVTILGIPGFCLSLLGIGFGYWTFSNYIATGTFPMGIAIASVFFGLAGVFASFTAIILHSLNQHLD
ncbi:MULTISPECIES: glycosyltransferase family 2 protein [unclassified Halorhabdus]|uniref:glycosyltransferase family 2 protein n=1 Tax=unclassified Halorhabdus TaxID=2621901 RepID=UPI0023DAAF24|nr:MULTISPECIES: glycosyltransferase family 2 protein [unclassified Halorhabdus]WEL16731.1 Glycosyl transferase family 2 [Halorhabdus sp. SVX81]WEL20602.1 Glycosyl transferase family 2 [Halorhabdus sp. BNX81]